MNENSAESVAIGDYYASKRGITHICRLRTAESESISREVFDREILRPVAGYLRANSLQDRILYIVTTRGVPMMVEGDLASVDSNLALVYRYLVTGSFPYLARIENPYFTVAGNFRPFLRRDFDIYLVTRLTAIDLVDRALSAEAGGDFYFDLVSPQPSTESDWVQQAAAVLKKAGFKATMENTAKLLNNLEGVQGYAAQRAADAPSIKWRPGAIAAILDKDAGRSVWSYVTSGVTGFGSYVADPLADGYFRPHILFPAYTAGYNLAESFYASCRYLGSTQVVIGDPLVAPYAKSAPPAQDSPIDKETGLPEFFAQRRLQYLMRKYSTSRETAILLLKEEDAKALNEPQPAPGPVPKAQEAQEEPVAESVESVAFLPQDFPVRLLSRTPIEYPFEAQAAQVQGTVLVDLLIDEYGQVMKADVIRGDKRLAKAVLDSVKRWRFEPKLENGRAVVGNFTLPVNFKLNKK